MNAVAHPLEDLLEQQRSALRASTSSWPIFWNYSSSGIQLALRLINACGALTSISLPESLRVFMWQSALKYEILCLNYIFLGELDPAFSLLRNALEVTRVATHIGDNPDRAKQWLASKFEEGRRLGSKFNESETEQEFLKRMFELTSTLGTHGHHNAFVWGELIPDSEGRQTIRVGREGTVSALKLWLSSFFMIQRAFVRGFYETHLAELDQLVWEYDQMEKRIDAVSDELSAQ
jgi:hypothetical protein